MDSGNSSSMQSSSGGCGGDQEEYDSRADQSVSTFFNNNTTTASCNIASSTQLDSFIANYFNTAWSTDNTLWSTTTTKPIDGYRQSQPILSEPLFLQQNPRLAPNNTNTSSPVSSVPTDKNNGLNNMAKQNPKKRSRVSRRAPTTVLTTDTSNFRAMVQEFTGNPSSPFTGLTSSSSSSFARSRFDLFGSSSSSSSSRPFKPFPQKLTPQATTTASHHHLTPPSDHRHQSLLLNMNTQNIANPFLSNQSPKNPLTDQSSRLKTSNGFGHVDVGTNFEGLHNIISTSSSMTQPTLKNNDGSDKNFEAANLEAVRNEGMVELSWISSSD